MVRARYPWDESVVKIFKDSKTGAELQDNLKKVFDDWLLNKKVPKEKTWKAFTEAAYEYAVRHNLWKSHHTFKPATGSEDSDELELTQAQQDAIFRKETMAAKRFEMLFGDLKKIPRVSIPKTAGDKPFEIKVVNDDRPKVVVINSPLVGTLQPASEAEDIFKNAIRAAAMENADSILITGNLLFCLVEKYGKQRPYQTQVVGIEPDPEILKAAYPPAVLKKIGPLTEAIDKNKIVFITIKVYLDSLFKMLQKKFLDEAGNPIFKGNVYVVLGEMEESIAMYYANEALRTEVFKEKSFAHKQIKELRLDLKIARKEENEKAVADLTQEISDWEVYDRLLALMGNVSAAVVNDRKQQMVNYLAYQIESNIPNAKVIGIGDVYLKIGKELVAVTNDKTSNSIKGGLAGRLRRGIYSYVKNHPGERVPQIILGAGLNPWGSGLYASFRIKDKKSTLDDVRMSDAIQLLPCIDSSLYRETVRRMLRVRGSEVAKLANTSNFESGAGILQFFEPGPFVKWGWLKSDYLTNKEIFASPLLMSSYKADNRAKVVNIYKEGCTHIGAMDVALYDSPEDKGGRYIKLHNQVLFETFVRIDAPIHLYLNDGDVLQWMNFQTHKEKNVKWKDQEQMLQEFVKIESDKSLSTEEKLKLIKTRGLENMFHAGIIQPEEQVEAWGRMYAPYAEFFKSVIDRALKSGIKVQGHLGIVSHGQGNHNENTFKRGDVRFSEARMISKEVLIFLLESGYKIKGLRDYIKACEMSGIGMAHGVFSVASLGAKAYEYCVFMKHKSGQSSKAEDNMKGMITSFSVRGSTDDYEEDRFTLNFGGDDHMGGHSVTRNAFHVKTGGQMFSGPFGFKLDFPKQNLFSTVCGVPAGGPAWGPLSVASFGFRQVRKLAAYKVEMPKELFDNPV